MSFNLFGFSRKIFVFPHCHQLNRLDDYNFEVIQYTPSIYWYMKIIADTQTDLHQTINQTIILYNPQLYEIIHSALNHLLSDNLIEKHIFQFLFYKSTTKKSN